MKHITKRALSLLLTLAMLCGLLCTTTFATNGTWSGSGTQTDPYLIADANDLVALSTAVNGGTTYSGTYFKLTADVDLTGINWNPIGCGLTKNFSGNFDGDGHTVTINSIAQNYWSSGAHYIGLFGYLRGVVHDVTVDGTISYSDSANAVECGGIAARIYGTSSSAPAAIVNCVNNADVTSNGKSTTSYSGGIVAYAVSNGNLYNNYNTGEVAGGKYSGGLVGCANGGNVKYCFTTTTPAFGYKSGAVDGSTCYAKGSAVTSTTGYTNSWDDFSDGDNWISTANAFVSAYTDVNNFWSQGSDGYPTHATSSTHQHTSSGAGVITAPTCTEQGYTTYTCSICGEAYVGNYVDALGHDLETLTVSATCTAPGSVTESCKREGCDYTATTVIPALGHEYVDGYCIRCNAKEPAIQTVTIGTGTTSGYFVPYCNYFRYTLSESIYTADEIGAAGAITKLAFQVATTTSLETSSVKIYMGHTSESVFSSNSDWIKAEDLTLVYDGNPTLGTATGWETITLDTAFDYNGTDNLVIAVSKSADGFSNTLKYYYTSSPASVYPVLYRYSDSVTTYADYDNLATTGYVTPSRANIQLTIDICQHENRSNVVVVAPTCTEEGNESFYCEDCGRNISEAIPALGHDWVLDEIVTAPTRTEEGVGRYACTRCGETKTESIPATVFNMDDDGNYLIESGSDLALLATKVSEGTDYSGATFKLTADVTASTSIGNNQHPFTGNFNGNYHTVTITINDSSKDYNGLFGAISEATVEKVIVKGTVTGGSFSAGVAGYAYDSVIRYCGNEAAITGGDNHTYGQNEGPNDCYAAGVVGYAVGGTRIIACYNKGTVTNAAVTTTTDNGGSKYTGGIVGNLYEGAVQYCYNTGAISINTSAGTSYTYTGGIAGMSWSNSIMNSYSTGTISGGNYAGGIVGSTNLYYQQGTYSYYLNTSASAGCGTGSDDPEYILSASSADLKSKTSTVGQRLGSSFVADQEGEDKLNDGYLILAWEIDPDAEVGYITEIYTGDQLREFANNVRGGHSYEGQTVSLMNDIDLGGTYDTVTGENTNIWTAIGNVNGGVPNQAFYGTFDGQNHTISNMVVVNDSSGYLGLFAVLPEGATVKNLEVSGSAVMSQSSFGTIAGWNMGTVDNCISNVNITATGYQYIGGIVGDNEGTVTNCVNNGTVNGSSSSSYIGGIVGRVEPRSSTATALVADCANYGDVTGYQYVGGIVGAMFNEDVLDTLSLTGCANEGDVTGYYYVGGIIGKASLGELTIKDCYSKGTVTATDTTYAGKIAGDTKADIYNTYYLLDSSTLLSAGFSSGDNYSRPVSAQYMATDAFTAMVFGVSEDTPSAMTLDDEGTTSSVYYRAYDVWTINIVNGVVTVTRLENALTSSIASITVNNQKYNVNEDDDETLIDDYERIYQAEFEVSGDYTAQDVTVNGEDFEITVVVGDTTKIIKLSELENRWSYLVNNSNFSPTLDYYSHKELTGELSGTLEISGVAGKYLYISDLITYLGDVENLPVSTSNVTSISFRPVDWYDEEHADDPDYYVRTIYSNNYSNNNGNNYNFGTEVALALTSFQSSDSSLIGTDPDHLNTPRLVYTIESEESESTSVNARQSVKWIDRIVINTTASTNAQ